MPHLAFGNLLAGGIDQLENFLGLSFKNGGILGFLKFFQRLNDALHPDGFLEFLDAACLDFRDFLQIMDGIGPFGWNHKPRILAHGTLGRVPELFPIRSPEQVWNKGLLQPCGGGFPAQLLDRLPHQLARVLASLILDGRGILENPGLKMLVGQDPQGLGRVFEFHRVALL